MIWSNADERLEYDWEICEAGGALKLLTLSPNQTPNKLVTIQIDHTPNIKDVCTQCITVLLIPAVMECLLKCLLVCWFPKFQHPILILPVAGMDALQWIQLSSWIIPDKNGSSFPFFSWHLQKLMPDLSGDYAGRFVTEVSNEVVSLFQVAASSIVPALSCFFKHILPVYFKWQLRILGCCKFHHCCQLKPIVSFKGTSRCRGIIIIVIMMICTILIFILWPEGGCCNDMWYIVIVSMKRKRFKTTWTQVWLNARKYNVCKKLQGPDNVKGCIQSDVKPLPPSSPTHPGTPASPVLCIAILWRSFLLLHILPTYFAS